MCDPARVLFANSFQWNQWHLLLFSIRSYSSYWKFLLVLWTRKTTSYHIKGWYVWIRYYYVFYSIVNSSSTDSDFFYSIFLFSFLVKTSKKMEKKKRWRTQQKYWKVKKKPNWNFVLGQGSIPNMVTGIRVSG